jgi:N-formylglutamate amidohydrolase
MTPLWSGQEAGGPVIAVAVHAGHHLRDEVATSMGLDAATRLREEDPFTDAWTTIAPTRLVACRSRFEVDLNRARDGAVYLRPDDAWGLEVWSEPPRVPVIERSLAAYDAFYDVLEGILVRAERAHGRFVVLDLHSYNHRRAGPDAPPDDAAGNPDLNVGTTALDRDRWAPLVDGFLEDLRAAPFSRSLDIRENVRFGGGHLSRWVAERFSGSGCALAIEVKKFFMDEHTGELDVDCHAAVGTLLASAVPGLVSRLEELEGR